MPLLDYSGAYEEVMREYRELVEGGVDNAPLHLIQELWGKLVAHKTSFNERFIQLQSEEMTVEQRRQQLFALLLARKYTKGPASIRKYEAIADPDHQSLVAELQEIRTTKGDFRQYVENCTDVTKYLSRVMTARLEELRSHVRDV